MTAIDDLRSAVSRLHDILREHGDASRARELPKLAHNRAQQMNFSAGRWLDKEDEPDLRRRFNEAQARITKDMVGEAEILRDQKLHDLVAELREIRTKLPDIVNLALSEILTSALMLEREALHGPPTAPPPPEEGIL